MKAAERSSLSLMALVSALLLVPAGFFLCLLMVFGSTHGDQKSIRPLLSLFGAVTTLPPVVLGVLGWKSGWRRWMSVVAFVLAALLAALYVLALVIARPNHTL